MAYDDDQDPQQVIADAAPPGGLPDDNPAAAAYQQSASSDTSQEGVPETPPPPPEDSKKRQAADTARDTTAREATGQDPSDPLGNVGRRVGGFFSGLANARNPGTDDPLGAGIGAIRDYLTGKNAMPAGDVAAAIKNANPNGDMSPDLALHKATADEPSWERKAALQSGALNIARQARAHARAAADNNHWEQADAFMNEGTKYVPDGSQLKFTRHDNGVVASISKLGTDQTDVINLTPRQYSQWLHSPASDPDALMRGDAAASLRQAAAPPQTDAGPSMGGVSEHVDMGSPKYQPPAAAAPMGDRAGPTPSQLIGEGATPVAPKLGTELEQQQQPQQPVPQQRGPDQLPSVQERQPMDRWGRVMTKDGPVALRDLPAVRDENGNITRGGYISNENTTIRGGKPAPPPTAEQRMGGFTESGDSSGQVWYPDPRNPGAYTTDRAAAAQVPLGDQRHAEDNQRRMDDLRRAERGNGDRSAVDAQDPRSVMAQRQADLAQRTQERRVAGQVQGPHSNEIAEDVLDTQRRNFQGINKDAYGRDRFPGDYENLPMERAMTDVKNIRRDANGQMWTKDRLGNVVPYTADVSNQLANNGPMRGSAFDPDRGARVDRWVAQGATPQERAQRKIASGRSYDAFEANTARTGDPLGDEEDFEKSARLANPNGSNFFGGGGGRGGGGGEGLDEGDRAPRSSRRGGHRGGRRGGRHRRH